MAELAVRPRAPFRLPRRTGGDLVLQRRGPWLERLLILEGEAMLVRARQGRDQVLLEAEPVDPGLLEGPGAEAIRPAVAATLEAGLDRLRFSLGIDDDLGEFCRDFRDDRLLGPALRTSLWQRPLRRALAWEALLWAITEQLIEYRRAAAIQRRMIDRFGVRMRSRNLASLAGRPGPGQSRRLPLPSCPPAPATIAGAAPAELEACGLSARRSLAMIRVAREVACGRVDPADPGGDRRLQSIPMIGPWTIACLALRGRGEPDALLAGDLAQVKLVGYLAGLGRLAEVEEVESFYAPYAPWRGLAGEYLAMSVGAEVQGPGNRARIRRQAGRAAA